MQATVNVAAVSTLPFDGDEEYRNAEQAYAHLEEAARNGADLICFPEGYPGPCFGPMDTGNQLSQTPVELLCEGARKHGVYVSCGNLEESEELPGGYYLTNKLIDPSGRIIANYRRCQPTTPVLNAGLYGGKQHVVPGNELMVADTELGKIGLLICSEMYVPELSRILMLKGAEIVLAPIGGVHRGPPKTAPRTKEDFSTERCVARARAAENLMYVVTTLNLFSREWKRGSFIAGPEGTIASQDSPGTLYGELDMDRIRYVRSRYTEERDVNPQDESDYRPQSIKYGIIHERRPELYQLLVEPQPDAYDYFYYKRGLEAWREEYEKVSKFTSGADRNVEVGAP